jgi:DNA replication protein DnaC
MRLSTMKAQKTATGADASLRDRILAYFQVLRVPVRPEEFDETLRRAEREGLDHLSFLEALIGPQTRARRERAIARRIKEALFHEHKTLEAFDWEFNKAAIDRVQFETLGTAEFVLRKDNAVIVGESGVGKSHLAQAIGIRACVAGRTVRYVTSASLLSDLTSALADRSLPTRLRKYLKPQLLIIDEFGFDKIERLESTEAASLLFKVIDARQRRGSVLLATNIDFDHWGSYLGDAPLAMALLDRLVDHATIIKIKKARSYRAYRARKAGEK